MNILRFLQDLHPSHQEITNVLRLLQDLHPSHQENKKFLSANLMDESKPIIALLPGSRIQEIKKMLPIFAQVARKFPNHQLH